MFLFVHLSVLGALQHPKKNHPAFPSFRILLGTAQTLQESRYFCAVSSTDQKCIKCTKVANHCVISTGWTVSSKSHGKEWHKTAANRTQAELPPCPKQACFCKQPLTLAQLCLLMPKAKPGALLPTSQAQALPLHSSPKAHDKMTKSLIL